MNPQTNSEQREEVLDVARQWAEAEVRADVATLDSLIDGDFLAVGPLGFVLTKAEWLNRHQSGDLKYQAHRWEDLSARHYGGTAIVVGALNQKATYRGREVPGDRYRVTQIAVRRGNDWVIAGLQLSPITVPPGR